MTLPTIVPTNFAGTSKDFLKAKFQADGTSFMVQSATTVASGTTTTTIVGLVPLLAGARIDVGATKLFCGALGTSVTVSLGIVYDDNVANTNNATLYASGLTAAAAGGELAITASAANLAYVTTGNGWLVATIGGATTGTSGDITVQALVDYNS